MRTGLRLDDVGGFLDEPIVAVLATYRKDGSVLLSPVWHEWRDGGFQIWTGSSDVKTRHLRRDPRASVLVAESDIPLRGVEVRGEPVIVTEGAVEAAERIAGRYLGAERGAEYVRTVGGNDVIIRLEPGELRVWDFVDEYE